MKSTIIRAAGVRPRLVAAASLIVLLASCGSGDGIGTGTGPGISATFPSDVSIVRPTQPPETDAAAPPAETAAPENQPAEQPEQTSAPESTQQSAAPGAGPSSTVAPADDGEGTVWWPWVLVAIIVIGAIVAIARRRRPSSSWQLQATTLLDEIDQLTIHLAALTPSGLQAVAQSDGMRLATMRATLGTVIATAPNDSNQAALNRLTTPIAALHGAVDAIASVCRPVGPTRQRLGIAACNTTAHNLGISARRTRYAPMTAWSRQP